MLDTDISSFSEIISSTNTGRDSVAMISEEFYEGKASIRVGRDEERKSNTVESQTSGSENNSGSSQLIANAHTNLAISINARSDRDSGHYNLYIADESIFISFGLKVARWVSDIRILV